MTSNSASSYYEFSFLPLQGTHYKHIVSYDFRTKPYKIINHKEKRVGLVCLEKTKKE